MSWSRGVSPRIGRAQRAPPRRRQSQGALSHGWAASPEPRQEKPSARKATQRKQSRCPCRRRTRREASSAKRTPRAHTRREARDRREEKRNAEVGLPHASLRQPDTLCRRETAV